MSDGIWPGKSLPSFTALTAESTAPHLVAENQDEWRAEHGDGVFEAGDRIDVSEIAGYAADKDISTTYVEGVFGSDARISRSAPAGTQAHDERVRIGFAAATGAGGAASVFLRPRWMICRIDCSVCGGGAI